MCVCVCVCVEGGFHKTVTNTYTVDRANSILYVYTYTVHVYTVYVQQNSVIHFVIHGVQYCKYHHYTLSKVIVHIVTIAYSCTHDSMQDL